MSEQPTVANAVHGRSRIWVPIAVVGVLLIVAAVEFLANRSLPAQERVEPGTVIEFGAGRFASVETGEGWSVDKSETKLDFQVVLVQDDANVTLNAVQFAQPGGATVEQMWEGMNRMFDTARYEGTAIELQRPEAFTTPNVDGGLSAAVQIEDQTGTAFVLPSEDGSHAVYGRVIGSGDTAGAAALVDSITITEEAS